MKFHLGGYIQMEYVPNVVRNNREKNCIWN